MHSFEDYFDSSSADIPYQTFSEELEDHLRLLDMILENYLEHKGISRDNKLFSRGLVITESEMKEYFDTPPVIRERDISDPMLSVWVSEAFSHIAARSESSEAPLRIRAVRQLFELTDDETIALIMALAYSIDRRYERIFGFLQDDVSRARPTLGLYHALKNRFRDLDDDLEDKAVPEPLSEPVYQYLFMDCDANSPLDTPLILNPIMKAVLTGISAGDELLPDAASVYEEDDELPVFFDDSYADIEYALESGGESPIYLSAGDEDTVLHLIYRYGLKHDERVYVLDTEGLTRMKRPEIRKSLSLLLLSMKLYDGRLVVRYSPEDERAGAVSYDMKDTIRFIYDRIASYEPDRRIIITGPREEPGELALKQIPVISVPDPDVSLRIVMWEYFLNASEGVRIAEDVSIPDIADCYDVTYGVIRNACKHAYADALELRDRTIDRGLILQSIRQINQINFKGMASYIRPSYGWDDITIEPSQLDVLKVACDRYRLRNRIGESWGLKKRNTYGNGISVLLYGPPGTGKTMAAQVISNELGLPLYRVDISQIFSKYIGETEKNLSVIFDAASRANVILFFDEADALFSKRTEVSNSNDKYSNSETAYLLQKVEEYDGMSLLATNYYGNFDQAFLRRITYSVHMDSPDADARYILWTSILPPEAQVAGETDFKFFADTFELSGSNIKAILYSAAYMAGSEGAPINNSHIVRAIQYEYRKLGLYIDTTLFGPYWAYLA